MHPIVYIRLRADMHTSSFNENKQLFRNIYALLFIDLTTWVYSLSNKTSDVQDHQREGEGATGSFWCLSQ